MKLLHLIIFLLLAGSTATQAQTTTQRTIQVNGMAEMEIEPDEIKFIIEIEEYWEEEFKEEKEPGAYTEEELEEKDRFEQYRTKVPLATIEDNLIKTLREVGIETDKIVVSNLGNYWRFRGKEFLYRKQFIITISDFSKINELAKIMDAKGIKYMNIGELNNTNIEEHKKQVKIKALQAAKEKAKYLVESMGKQLGDVVSIVELGEGFNQPVFASTMLRGVQTNTQESINQVKNINLSYQVQATFSIK
ncbi:MAG: SIMPL domain-containing protein [Prolixibacteraceae bacterium]|nr:SIMPL domain-containing protein [Prolixibacteraceae bacterium]